MQLGKCRRCGAPNPHSERSVTQSPGHVQAHSLSSSFSVSFRQVAQQRPLFRPAPPGSCTCSCTRLGSARAVCPHNINRRRAEGVPSAEPSTTTSSTAAEHTMVSDRSKHSSVNAHRMQTEHKRVYRFGTASSEGDSSMKDLLGGKGANLADMAKMGLPVPAGFTITTAVCQEYNENNRQLPGTLWQDVQAAMREVENERGRTFGGSDEPLLFSVRSGAAVSMPGMMDTVLNVGLNDDNVEQFGAKTNRRFALDSYRRLLQMFGDVVIEGLDNSDFEAVLENVKKQRGVTNDVDLDESALAELVERYKGVYQSKGKTFPQDPYEQLHLAIRAVFDSWENPRAKRYRAINGITGLLGTAVNCQSMAFGNKGSSSGTGVLFTRNPTTGEASIYGEYLPEAQGEDVVAGIRTPYSFDSLQKAHPQVHEQLVEICKRLETYYKDMQDVEFTVEEGELYMLQCRSAKRTGVSAVRVAVEMCKEGIINEDDAIERVQSHQLEQMLHPQLSNADAFEHLGKGLNASPGAAVGKVILDSEEAEKRGQSGEKVVLVRTETASDDIGGMHESQGILTSRGGMTSHAAVVARGWGKPAVVGCGDALHVDEENACVYITKPDGSVKRVEKGEMISVDGSSGAFYAGEVPVMQPKEEGQLKELMRWVDERRQLKVMANADEPEAAQKARDNGAQGIGLTRTEHMFFKTEERLTEMQSMILAESEDERNRSLSQLQEFQRHDFTGLFKVMDGYPVCIRLLDPPLHEFIPQGAAFDDLANKLAERWNTAESELRDRASNLREANPMMGLRGCRLGILYPEITRMQARAIIEAAKDAQVQGYTVHPEIMVPLVSTPGELEHQRQIIDEVAQGHGVDYKVGTMLETPRAAMDAKAIASQGQADFFSFGTNDLTQFACGLSRDDGGRIIQKYVKDGILTADPFQVLDQSGVGELMRQAAANGKRGNPDIVLSACGEQGGEVESVMFCHEIGLHKTSCSAFRIPTARLGAAKAAVRAKKREQ